MPRKTPQEQGGVNSTRKSERPAEAHAPPSTALETTPAEVLDRSDPGDAVQRNFRYQHAYGVILLIGAATGRLPYVAIWCEHHEDILAERTDGKWDGYQIKTRQREAGDWHLGDEELCNGIKHLATMDGRFPGRIEALHIVSNARFLNTQSKEQIHRSPVQLLHAVSAVPAPANLVSPFGQALSRLSSRTELPRDTLFAVLRKMKLHNGPERESFDAEIAHNHVSTLDGCSGLPRAQLNAIRDELVARVYRASSLYNDDPARHWCCVSGADRRHPDLAAKRIPVDEALTISSEARNVPFRYLPGSSSLAPGTAHRKISVFEKKLLAAGLQSQVDVLQAKMLATERRLLEFGNVHPEQMRLLLDQIESVVQGEYAEALLAAGPTPVPYGIRLLRDVYGRLRTVAQDRPELVYREPYETLVGIAALLTADCQLWWGPRFDLGSAA